MPRICRCAPRREDDEPTKAREGREERLAALEREVEELRERSARLETALEAVVAAVADIKPRPSAG